MLGLCPCTRLDLTMLGSRLDQTREVPVLLITGTGRDDRLAERAYRMGAAGFLVKPVDPGRRAATCARWPTCAAVRIEPFPPSSLSPPPPGTGGGCRTGKWGHPRGVPKPCRPEVSRPCSWPTPQCSANSSTNTPRSVPWRRAREARRLVSAWTSVPGSRCRAAITAASMSRVPVDTQAVRQRHSSAQQLGEPIVEFGVTRVQGRAVRQLHLGYAHSAPAASAAQQLPPFPGVFDAADGT